MEADGYYAVSTICVAIGAILLVAYIWPAAKRLQGAFRSCISGRSRYDDAHASDSGATIEMESSIG